MARALALGLLLVLVSWAPASGDPAQPVADLVAHPKTNWLTNGGNLYNQRFSPLAQITRDNVQALKGVWHVRLNGSGVGPPYSGEAQPIVDDGVMYVVTGANDVFAIRIDSGAFVWVYESGLEPGISTACCGWTSRGVAIGEGKLFLGRLDGKLVALDLATGEEVWSVQAERWQDGFTITSAPLYYDGMIVTGFAGAEYGVRGRVKAFQASDGSPIWTFYTVPAPGEFGADTWPSDSEIWKRGGATVWNTPAVDPELGLLYFSTANPGPDFNGSLREGDNLFSVSMIALEARTGAYRWHFQQVHHDLWDYDASTPVVLFDVEIEGQPRKAIAEAGKTGWVYILDRTDGTPLLGIDEKPVPQDARQHTSATQPIPVGDAFVPQEMEMPLYGYPLVNGGKIFTPFWEDIIPIRPGTFGGTTWAAPSYDPRTHSLFICGMDNIGLFTGGTVDGRKPQEQFLGGSFLFDTVRTGVFAAMSLQTNRLVWRHRWEDACYSGSTATAGDLVFVGMNDGRFVALDSRNGDALWEFQTGAGVNAPPAVFEHRGQQMVAVYAAGALFAQSPPGDSVWLFSLSGELDEVPPGTPPAMGGVLAGGAVRGNEGEQLYGRFCGQCHGNERQGGHGGGPALPSSLDPGRVLTFVTQGSARMPGFGSQLTYDQVTQLVAYLTEDPAP